MLVPPSCPQFSARRRRACRTPSGWHASFDREEQVELRPALTFSLSVCPSSRERLGKTAGQRRHPPGEVRKVEVEEVPAGEDVWVRPPDIRDERLSIPASSVKMAISCRDGSKQPDGRRASLRTSSSVSAFPGGAYTGTCCACPGRGVPCRDADDGVPGRLSGNPRSSSHSMSTRQTRGGTSMSSGAISS